MAISKLEVGAVPLGVGGDSLRSAAAKINENFSNTSHAASRFVGKNGANLVQVSDVAEIARSVSPVVITLPDTETDLSKLPTGSVYKLDTTHPAWPSEIPKITSGIYINTYAMTDSSSQNTQVAYHMRGRDFWIRKRVYGGGSNDYSNWAKIYTSGNTTKDSNSNLLLDSGNTIPNTSAAGRLVGTESGQLAEWTAYNGISGTGLGGRVAIASNGAAGNRMKEGDIPYMSGFYGKVGPLDAPTILGLTWQMVHLKYNDANSSMLVFSSDSRDKSIYLAQKSGGNFGEWIKFYGTGNTKLDTNGAIAPSSPTIDLYSDRIETNDDGSRMNPEFIRNGVGDYTIKNTTGLRDEGWYIKIPNDMNGNPKVAVAVDTDKDGNLSIKTYRRIFSMETFTFVPDLETPLDIPEGRWIDLRFNDIPVEPLIEIPDEIEDEIPDEIDDNVQTED